MEREKENLKVGNSNSLNQSVSYVFPFYGSLANKARLYAYKNQILVS